MSLLLWFQNLVNATPAVVLKSSEINATYLVATESNAPYLAVTESNKYAS